MVTALGVDPHLGDVCNLLETTGPMGRPRPASAIWPADSRASAPD
jgi:hypothetical protein